MGEEPQSGSPASSSSAGGTVHDRSSFQCDGVQPHEAVRVPELIRRRAVTGRIRVLAAGRSGGGEHSVAGHGGAGPHPSADGAGRHAVPGGQPRTGVLIQRHHPTPNPRRVAIGGEPDVDPAAHDGGRGPVEGVVDGGGRLRDQTAPPGRARSCRSANTGSRRVPPHKRPAACRCASRSAPGSPRRSRRTRGAACSSATVGSPGTGSTEPNSNSATTAQTTKMRRRTFPSRCTGADPRHSSSRRSSHVANRGATSAHDRPTIALPERLAASDRAGPATEYAHQMVPRRPHSSIRQSRTRKDQAGRTSTQVSGRPAFARTRCRRRLVDPAARVVRPLGCHPHAGRAAHCSCRHLNRGTSTHVDQSSFAYVNISA